VTARGGRRRRWDADDVPDQAGRVAVVTGANTGIGFAAAELLARRGATVVLACRDAGRAEVAAERIRAGAPGDVDVHVVALDLADLGSVHDAAAVVRDRWDRIDVLLNNAGVMAPPATFTADGVELQFATNHLGHFAWTGLLLDRLLPVPGSRVVAITSTGHRLAPRDVVGAAVAPADGERPRYRPLRAYGGSKLANLVYAYELQRRLEAAGVPTRSLAAHPGSTRTEVFRHQREAWPAVLRPAADFGTRFVSQPAAAGALPGVRAATDPEAVGGTCYGPRGLELRGLPVVVRTSGRSRDVRVQRELWDRSEELTGVHHPV
jgi:NAD(P)-dependent dehydrogenase (short-subunit alcohol dehydrogenase family)